MYPADYGSNVVAKIPVKMHRYGNTRVTLIGQMSCDIFGGVAVYVLPYCVNGQNYSPILCGREVRSYTSPGHCHYMCYCKYVCSYILLSVTQVSSQEETGHKICEVMTNV